MPVNAMEEVYTSVTLLMKPALFTALHIDRATVPDGLYAYDIRHGDEFGRASTVEKQVRVNHMGTVILSEPLDFKGAGYIPLNEENGGLNFHAEHDCATVAAYMEQFCGMDDMRHKEAETIKRYISQNQGSLSVTQTQRLLCGIGEALHNAGGEQDQYYLFSHSMGSFAGFCGDPIGVNDTHGDPLYVGDMTCLNGNPDKPQMVFLHSTGDPFPSAEYVKEAKVSRLAGWQDSMMYLRSRDFDVYSCRGDYRMSKQIASRISTKNQERGRPGR